MCQEDLKDRSICGQEPHQLQQKDTRGELIVYELTLMDHFTLDAHLASLTNGNTLAVNYCWTRKF